MPTLIFVRIQNALTQAFRSDEGQGLTEYALILALIAIVAIAALTLLGHKVTNALSTVGNSLTT
jgi:pilus assembly protein Flp/PilA